MNAKTKRLPQSVLTSSLLAAAALIGTGCYETDGQLYINHTTPLSGAQQPSCAIQSIDNVQVGGLIDIGSVGVTYTNVLKVSTNLPANITTTTLNEARETSPNYPNSYGVGESSIVLLDTISVYLTDSAGEPLDGVPGVNNPRITAVGGALQNVQGTLAGATALAVQSVSVEDAVALRQENALANGQLEVDANARETIVAHMQVTANTAGGGFLRSQIYSFPLQVCIGCLVAIGGNGGQCNGGQDAPILHPDANTCVPPGQDLAYSVCP